MPSSPLLDWDITHNSFPFIPWSRGTIQIKHYVYRYSMLGHKPLTSYYTILTWWQLCGVPLSLDSREQGVPYWGRWGCRDWKNKNKNSSILSNIHRLVLTIFVVIIYQYISQCISDKKCYFFCCNDILYTFQYWKKKPTTTLTILGHTNKVYIHLFLWYSAHYFSSYPCFACH